MKRNIREISAKTLLSFRGRPGSWFGVSGTMNIYRGCSHGCIYCDSRSLCYGANDFDREIQVKANYLDLFPRELAARGRGGVISFGSMSDCYMPVEEKLCCTRRSLEVLRDRRYPVFILTKSDLVLRDLDLFTAIAKDTWACVAFTVTTSDDSLAAIVEPGASSPTRRFRAMKALSRAGILTGTLIMPLLPFIQDSESSLSAIIHKTALSGGSFLVPSLGMTLRDRQRDYFFEKLDIHFPGLRQKYVQTYGLRYDCAVPRADFLMKHVLSECSERGLKTEMPIRRTLSSSLQMGMF
ncbi:MAG: radical SAM protein [Candidatus Wallbacteria bacterium HGW-Wallbacteria-1]|jgi:DNA repair photolyase|uniref:Radical SAM protein n=1 Tax=Candidatus Wallbacteria bacterium HGW-Wallbacteria-1 TaxID=2013854 RepID=A0A2N1PMW0_9BACT|nr:MAG: radical SAM protein [Candidatus Wallbacteria bacterium HGW-Wallbacteria-1]